MFCPGHGLQALLLHFLMADGALAIFLAPDALKSLIDQVEHIAIGAGLTEQKLLGVGIGGLSAKSTVGSSSA